MGSRDARRRDRIVRWTWGAGDSLIFGVAIVLACWLRYDFHLSAVLTSAVAGFAVAAVAGQLVVGGVFGPYAVGHQRGSFEEIADVATTVGCVGAGLFLWAMLVDPVLIPRSVPIVASVVALVGMFGSRFLLRAVWTRRVTQRKAEHRVILFGAGDAGRRLLHSILEDPRSDLVPVALLDDDPAKARLRILGVRVRGNRHALATVAERYAATHLVIALPNADAALIREVSDEAEALGLHTFVLPPLDQIMDGSPTTQDLRDVRLEDLLGRQPIQLDQDAISAEITGRVVLVTGAGGSIGSELCRQIANFAPAKLLLLDRDESALHATQLTLQGHGLLDGDDVLLVNIRDREALRTVFQQHRPQVVFHAAALKHLPLLERYPLEAWKTNVLGTLNVLEAAEQAGVETFVNVSTDKAANPGCVLGYSKRLAERITADFARRGRGRFVSVRFGNVLGSRGSVVPAFTAQIRKGGPVTVTDPEVRRFFMLIPEACQLVLQAGAMGSDGDVMVLEMGEQVPIVQVAETLIKLSGREDVGIVYTGLRPGEKLEEELFYPGESRASTEHPLVSSVPVPPINVDEIRQTQHGAHEEAAQWMQYQAQRAAHAMVKQLERTAH